MRLLGEWLDDDRNRFTLGFHSATGQLRFDIDLADRGRPASTLVEARQIPTFRNSLRARCSLLLAGTDGARLQLRPLRDVAFAFELSGPQGAYNATGTLLYAIADHMVTVIDTAAEAPRHI